MCKINKPQGCAVQHSDNSQYFIMSVRGIQPLNVVNHCVVHTKVT